MWVEIILFCLFINLTCKDIVVISFIFIFAFQFP